MKHHVSTLLAAVVVAALVLWCVADASSAGRPRRLLAVGRNGKVVYGADAQGNCIPDLSHCGYMGGGAAIPDAPVKRTLAPVADREVPGLPRSLDAPKTGNVPPAAGHPKAGPGERVFSLTYHEPDGPEAVLSGNVFQHRLPGKPVEIKTLPRNLSGQAVYFALPVGPRRVLAVLDAASPPRLFVDVAGTGDLSAVQPLEAKPWGPLRQFGPVTIPVNGKAGSAVRVRFLCAGKGNVIDSGYLAVAPAGYMAENVSLNGQPYRVALVDHGLTGRYDNALQGERNPVPLTRCDTFMAFDLDQDGRLPPIYDTGETLPLLPALHVKDAYYNVRVAPDGSSIALAKAEPDFGTLDTGCPDLGVVLIGEYGGHDLSGSDGKWRIPAGWHAAVGATLTRTDGAGTAWTLHGVSSWGRLARFKIRAGETLLLRAGTPLSVKVNATRLQRNGMIHLALALVGQGTEQYNAAARKGGVPQPPRFRVLNEAGEVLDSRDFNAGGKGTYCWCWWRVPEGFTGKYRVDVEGNWGPFEVKKGPPKWFSAK